MDPVHREVLDIHHSRLVTSLRATDVIDRLLKEEAISKYDYDQMKRTEAQGARAMNRLLLLTLRRRGGEAYPVLHRALRDSAQDGLSDVLLDTELSLREGLVTERMQRSMEAYSFNEGLNGLLGTPPPPPPPPPPLGLGLAVDHPSPPPTPILKKASSPARRKAALAAAGSREDESGSEQHLSVSEHLSKEKEERKAKQMQELKEELQEIRKSQSQMQAELKEQLQQLEKEAKEAGGKKGGGCMLM